MTELSVTRVISELKTLTNRIEDASTKLKVVGVMVNGKLQKATNQTREEFESSAKKDFQSIIDLIEYRKKLKGALIKSNAETLVTLCGVKLSVAQVIEYKESIQMERDLYHHIALNLQRVNNDIHTTNEQAALQMHKSAEAVLTKATQKDSEEYKSFCETFMKKQEASILDPIGVLKVLESLNDRVVEFDKEFDITLSESNARTMITLSD